MENTDNWNKINFNAKCHIYLFNSLQQLKYNSAHTVSYNIHIKLLKLFVTIKCLNQGTLLRENIVKNMNLLVRLYPNLTHSIW